MVSQPEIIGNSGKRAVYLLYSPKRMKRIEEGCFGADSLLIAAPGEKVITFDTAAFINRRSEYRLHALRNFVCLHADDRDGVKGIYYGYVVVMIIVTGFGGKIVMTRMFGGFITEILSITETGSQD